MWEYILRQLGLCDDPIVIDNSADVLHDKIMVLLHRSSSLTHFNITKKMIAEYSDLMKQYDYPLSMVEKYNNLITLWNHRYKLWKRG